MKLPEYVTAIKSNEEFLVPLNNGTVLQFRPNNSRAIERRISLSAGQNTYSIPLSTTTIQQTDLDHYQNITPVVKATIEYLDNSAGKLVNSWTEAWQLSKRGSNNPRAVRRIMHVIDRIAPTLTRSVREPYEELFGSDLFIAELLAHDSESQLVFASSLQNIAEIRSKRSAKGGQRNYTRAVKGVITERNNSNNWRRVYNQYSKLHESAINLCNTINEFGTQYQPFLHAIGVEQKYFAGQRVEILDLMK